MIENRNRFSLITLNVYVSLSCPPLYKFVFLSHSLWLAILYSFNKMIICVVDTFVAWLHDDNINNNKRKKSKNRRLGESGNLDDKTLRMMVMTVMVIRVFDKNLLSFQGRSLDFLTSHQHCRIRLKFHGDHWHRWVQVNSCDGVSLSGWWIVGTNSLWQWAHNSIHSIGLIEEMVEKNAMSSISQENVTERLNEKGEWLRARERNGGYMF